MANPGDITTTTELSLVGKPTLIGFVVGGRGVLIEIEIDFRRVRKEVHMSETYHTVVTNGKKKKQNKPEQFQT
jgi:hypothetical protein